jgi:isochorismate hydrolase
MREAYFSPESIDAKAAGLLQELGGARRLAFEPERSALLILDMQRYFLEPDSHAYVPSAPAILPGLGALAQTYAACDRPVIFTRHVNTPETAGMMAEWWREVLTAENPRSDLTPEMDAATGVVMPKSQYDAFYQTSLEADLRSRGVTQVVIGGVMTHLCCETTARSAFVRGFQVFFLVDGTATYTEAFHRAALLNLAHGFVTLMLVSEILSAVGRAYAR